MKILLFAFLDASSDFSQTVIFYDILKKGTVKIKLIWKWVGYPKPNYLFMKDGKK